MTPYHLGAGGPCRGAAWILQTLPLCYSTKMTANKYLAIVKLKKKHFTVYRPTPFLMVKVNSVNSSIPPLFSIRSKLHPKHRHRSCRCGRLQWIVGIRLGDIGGGSGRLVGAAKIGRFSDFRFLLGTFWRSTRESRFFHICFRKENGEKRSKWNHGSPNPDLDYG